MKLVSYGMFVIIVNKEKERPVKAIEKNIRDRKK